MEIPKDVFEYLTNFADDATIVSMLSTNKKYNNPLFFEKIMKRKYPLLLKIRKNESIKIFYLRMIHYISKLKEEFSISFDGTYNPEKFYNFLILLSPFLQILKSSNYLYKEDKIDNLERYNSIDIIFERFKYKFVIRDHGVIFEIIDPEDPETPKIISKSFPQMKDIAKFFIGKNPRRIELIIKEIEAILVRLYPSQDYTL